MGMATIHAAALAHAESVGTGQTEGTGEATLCRMNLSAGERAASFRGQAISDQGEVHDVAGLGVMVPEVGWAVNAAGSGARLELVDGVTLDLIVVGISGTSNWIGRLEAVFDQSYNAS